MILDVQRLGARQGEITIPVTAEADLTPRVRMRVQPRLQRAQFGSASCNSVWGDLQHFSSSHRTLQLDYLDS